MTYLTFPELEKAGRLGNQLWQIASTVGLARTHGMEPRFLPSWSYRPFFSVPEEMFSDDQGPDSPSLVTHLDPRAVLYLQDLSLWKHVEGEVLKMFQPSAEAQHRLASVELPDLPRLVMHVRRGDYLQHPNHFPFPGVDYYKRAAYHYPRHNIIVFTDDAEWCRSVLQPSFGRTSYLVPGIPRPTVDLGYATAPVLDWMDIFLMAECGSMDTVFVLSNSTFSWWGAWLSGAHEVYYPDPWYGPEIPFVDAGLMMPEHWQRRGF